MKELVYRGNCWPNEEQRLILAAGLFNDDRAIQAWDRWLKKNDLRKIRHAEFNLLPLVYRNLSNRAYENPSLKTLKGAYRQTWITNQLMFQDYNAVVSALEQKDITKFILLKGAAMTNAFYRDYGIRPQGDIDMLLSMEDSLLVGQLLINLGWKAKLIDGIKINNDYLRCRTSFGFVAPNGFQLDVHTNILNQAISYIDTSELINNSVSYRFNALTGYVLCPSDMLLHVLVHGAQQAPSELIRWVADAMTILNQSDGIDWNRFYQLSEQAHLIVPVKYTLSYLQKYFDAPVPIELLQSLHKVVVPKIFVREFKFNTSSRVPTFIALISRIWYMHTRQQRVTNIFLRLMSFPRFLLRFWSIQQIWQLPFYMILKIIRYIKNNYFTSIHLKKS